MKSHPLPFPRIFFLLAFTFTTSAVAAAAAKPNIVYTMANELGYFETGFMGGTTMKTPHLDRLAQV